METSGKQTTMKLAFGVQNGPKDAPTAVVRQIESEAQALAVMMHGQKAAAIALSIGKSEGYVSRLRSGKRDIPHALIGPLCAATGSNLLRQYIELERALNGRQSDVCRLAEMMRGAA